MKLLGIDPGLHTGFAILKDGELVQSGVWHVGEEEKFRGGGWRFLIFRRKLIALLDSNPDIEAVAYEVVRRHGPRDGTAAAHVWGALTGIMQLVLEERQIPYTGFGVKEIKKHFTGTGNASKELMCEKANQRFNKALDANKNEDDEADAIATVCLLKDTLEKI